MVQLILLRKIRLNEGNKLVERMLFEYTKSIEC